LDALASENPSECIRVLGISIKQQVPLAAKESLVYVGDVACDLHHPQIVRMRCHSGDMYGSGGDVDEEQDIVRDETLDRADLDAQEVRRCQTLPMGFHKCRPSWVRISLGSGLDPVLLQGVGNGAPSNLMSQIGQCTADSRVSPGGVFKRHLHNEIHDRFHDTRATRTTPMTVIPFQRYEFAMPAQKRVRRNQGFKLVQHLPPDCTCFPSQEASLGVGEANAAPTQALLEYSVLLLKILDHIQLMAVDPTSEHQQE
jgi:hypothetical protein